MHISLDFEAESNQRNVIYVGLQHLFYVDGRMNSSLIKWEENEKSNGLMHDMIVVHEMLKW